MSVMCQEETSEPHPPLSPRAERGRCPRGHAILSGVPLPRGLLLLGLLWLILSPLRAWAGTVPLIDLLPPDVDRARIRSSLTRSLKQPVALKPVPPELLEPLRWAGDLPAQQACLTARADVAQALEQPLTPPPPADELLRRLLTRADRNLLALKLELVQPALTGAWRLLPCLDAVVRPDQLRTLLVLEAVTHFYRHDGKHEQAFLELLAVDPLTPLGPDFPPKVQEAFQQARTKLEGVAPVSLIRPGGGEGLEPPLYLDGGRQEGGSFSLRPGRHLIQLTGPQGEVRGKVLVVRDGGGKLNLDLSDVLATPSQASRALAATLRAREVSPALAQALDVWLKRSGRSLAGFVLEDGRGQTALRLYALGEGLQASSPAAVARLAEDDQDTWGDRGRHTAVPTREREELEALLGPRAPTPVFSLGLAVSSQAIPGDASLLWSPALGLRLGGAWPAGSLQVLGRLEAGIQGRDRGQGCEGFAGGAPTQADVDAAGACLSGRPTLGVAVGAGLPIGVGKKLKVSPEVWLEGLYLPGLLVPGASAETWKVYSVLAAGPGLGGRATWPVYDGRTRVEVVLEVEGSSLFTSAGGRMVTLLGFQGSLGAAFSF